MSFLLKPLAFISASAISLLGLVSTRSKKARYYFHLTLYFSTMGLCSVLGVVYSIALSLVGQVSRGPQVKIGHTDMVVLTLTYLYLPLFPFSPLHRLTNLNPHSA
jgi:hypothetical protein